MKKSSWIIILGTALVILAVLFWRTKSGVQALQQKQAQQSVETSNVAQNVTKTSVVIAPTNAILKSNDLEKTNEVIASIEAKNSPIVFFGVVIDQNTNPVSGAKIHSTIRQWYVRSPLTLSYGAHFISVEKESDLNGRFEINGEKGDGFGVGIEKNGYQLSPKAPKGFGPTAGTFENPVIFNMWKEGEKAQLAGGSKFWGIIPDGRIYTIDLLQTTKVESTNAAGDLRISVSRPEGVSRQDHYDWSFQIVPIDGGIMEAADDFMYEAPENGYMPEYNFHLNKSDIPWAYRVKTNFFIKTRGGQNYGRITLEVFAHYQNQGVIDISWSVNPSGSRNLQP